MNCCWSQLRARVSDHTKTIRQCLAYGKLSHDVTQNSLSNAWAVHGDMVWHASCCGLALWFYVVAHLIYSFVEALSCISMSQEREDNPPRAMEREEEEDEEYDPTDEAALTKAFGFEDPEHVAKGSSQAGDEPKAHPEP